MVSRLVRDNGGDANRVGVRWVNGIAKKRADRSALKAPAVVVAAFFSGVSSKVCSPPGRWRCRRVRRRIDARLRAPSQAAVQADGS